MDGFPASKKRKLEHRSEEYEESCQASGTTSNTAVQLLDIENALCRSLNELDFISPVTHIYNPLEYAAETHSDYVHRYGNTRKKILFVGMNPGPFGMAQNGVAFGDTAMVKEWLQITGQVGKPAVEHPDRPIHGLSCERKEVSGTRFWGLFKDISGSPENFFRNCYVHNYCPLCFMRKSGKNITPPELKGTVKTQLQEMCDQALQQVMELLQVEWVLGVGKYGADRAKAALKSAISSQTGNKKAAVSKKGTSGVETFILHPTGDHGNSWEVHVSCIMHPSPVNPAANKGWAGIVTSQLEELGLLDTVRGIK